MVSNVKFIKNEAIKPPKLKAYHKTVLKGNVSGALPSIPPRVIMIHDVRSCQTRNIS